MVLLIAQGVMVLIIGLCNESCSIEAGCAPRTRLWIGPVCLRPRNSLRPTRPLICLASSNVDREGAGDREEARGSDSDNNVASSLRQYPV